MVPGAAQDGVQEAAAAPGVKLAVGPDHIGHARHPVPDLVAAVATGEGARIRRHRAVEDPVAGVDACLLQVKGVVAKAPRRELVEILGATLRERARMVCGVQL